MSTFQPQFRGSVPENYDQYLVPILFQPFAESMAGKVGAFHPSRVLELACGTGSVTRCLAATLPSAAQIVATDVSPAMLDYARQRWGQSAAIKWRTADACELPFDDESFDAVVCQFGVMFFPDKPTAMSEILRVLSPGGHLTYSAWSDISSNLIFHSVERTLTAMFPEEETPFMPTPLSMSDPEVHRRLAKTAGFDAIDVSEETHNVGPDEPASLAAGFAFGTPLGIYLGSQGYDLEKVRFALAEGFASDLGDPLFGTMRAVVCHAIKR